MSMPRTNSLRTWFVFDDTAALHRLPAIEKGLQTARNFGGAMLLGLHSFPKLVEVYGEEGARNRSEEHTSELQSLMRISYAVFCLKKKNGTKYNITHET